MAELRYQVIFQGKTVPDTPIEDVKANLAKLFKTNDVQDKPVVFRTGRRA